MPVCYYRIQVSVSPGQSEKLCKPAQGMNVTRYPIGCLSLLNLQPCDVIILLRLYLASNSQRGLLYEVFRDLQRSCCQCFCLRGNKKLADALQTKDCCPVQGRAPMFIPMQTYCSDEHGREATISELHVSQSRTPQHHAWCGHLLGITV